LILLIRPSHDIRTKPDPDIFLNIIEQGGFKKQNTIVVGDSIWDVRAARTAGLKCVCVLTGGFYAHELRGEGADEIYDNVEQLRAHLDTSLIMQ